MIRICSVVTLAGFAAWGVRGFRISLRMRKEQVNGPLVGFAAWRSESYTPAGQRYLREFKRWGLYTPIFMLLLMVVGGLVCYLLGEPASP